MPNETLAAVCNFMSVVMGLSYMLQCFPGVLVEMGSGQEGEAQSVNCWYVIGNMELLGQFMVGRVCPSYE